MRETELAQIGTWTYNLDSGLVDADAKLKNIFGVDLSLEDAPLDLYVDRIHEDDRAEVTRAIEQALQGHAGGEYQVAYRVNREGDTREVVAKGYLERDRSRAAVRLRGLVVDVTDSRRAERALAAEKRVLEMIASGCSQETTLDYLIESLESQSSSGMLISVHALEQASGTLRNAAAPSLPEEYNQVIDGLVIGEGVGVCGTAAALGKTVLVKDIASDPACAEFKELALCHGLAACSSYPIISSDSQVLGTIAVYYRECRIPTEYEMQLMETASHLCGILLERSLAETATRRNAQEFRSLANSIPQLAWMANPEGQIFWFNDVWYQYTGTTEDEMTGWGWQSVHDPQRIEEVVERWTASLDSRQPFEMEFPLRGADGKFRMFLTRAQPIRDDQGGVIRWFGTNTDIEELQRHKRERERLLTEAEDARKEAIELSQQLTIERDKLQISNQSLAEASRMKSDFLATLSHEIRTPLTGIVGNCELLAKGALDARQREYVDTITLCSDALLAMISDVLDFSKIEAGKLEMEKAIFSPLRTIEDSMRLTHELAVAKGLGIGLEIDRALPAAVWGDETRLRQVLLNLISNAIKFTPEGTVRVKVDWSRDNGVVELRVDVSDTGIGIEASAQDRLFLRFSQVDTSAARRFEGTGLGLAISRELVKKMDGEISVRSEAGVGSTFSFRVRLPEACTEDHVSKTPESYSGGRGARPLRVLLAEDNLINRKTLKMQLELQGLETECAENGEVALKALADRNFDLVLMDCHMPVMDGYETTRRLRQSPGPNQSIIVIALTASVIKGERERCLAAGMTDYLSKPIPMAVLSQTLDRWFKQSLT